MTCRIRGCVNGRLLFNWLTEQIKIDKEYLIRRLSAGVIHRPSGCVEWANTGGQTRAGCRRLSATIDGKEIKFYVHHVFWTLTNKRPIPVGHEIDHTCRNPACVRHLQLVTWRENLILRNERQKENTVPF